MPLESSRTRSFPIEVNYTFVENGGNGASGATAGTKTKSQKVTFDTDEGPRADTSMEALGKLKPVFHAHGVVTAGNSSQMSDAAAASVVMSGERARALGLKPLARFVAFATAGCPPEEMGVGPVYAIPKALKIAGLKLDQIDVIELNEAFAAQALTVIKLAGLDPARVNVNGGAVALGHPLGCTGAKLTATILREMERRQRGMGWSRCASAEGWEPRGFLSALRSCEQDFGESRQSPGLKPCLF